MTRRSILRILRWAGLAAVAPIVWACNARSFEKPVLKPEATFMKTFQQTINRNVDMLFLVDDSSSMKLSQDNLRRNFPTFMTRLKEDPGLPNIHVAVVSSDMGAGDGSVGGCNTSKQGVFQYTAKPPPVGSTDTPCTTNLDAGATYISDVGGVRNYGGEIEDAFSCIARLGQEGCGFEHQFAAILRALGADGAPAPAENQGFLRPDAYLVIILITNEDDCSASPAVPLFDVGSNFNLASQLGPAKNFRCNEFGHVCAGMHPNRNAPGNDITQTVSYADCTSNDTEGYLLSTVDTANRIKGLKAKASQVIVAAITGPSTPYVVHWIPPTSPDTTCGAASCPWPEISHSCGSVDAPGGFADPAVRINQFVDQFGDNGLKLPICSDNFAGSLDRIAMLINETLQPPCIAGTVAKKPGTQDDDCTVVSHTSNGLDGFVDAAVPSCASGAPAPCWQLAPGGACGGFTVNVSPDPAVPMSTTQNATVNCALCTPGISDPARGCP